MTWQDISSAPKDGTHVDLWAKKWLPSDSFAFKRFTNYCWGEKIPYCNSRGEMWSGGRKQWVKADPEQSWIGERVREEADWFPSDWCITHWMPLPDPPEAA